VKKAELPWIQQREILFSATRIQPFVHETTHGGQYEDQEVGFDILTGKPYASDLYDEVAGYKAQFAYEESLVSGLKSSSTPNSFISITTSSWVQGLTKKDESMPYSPGCSANTGLILVNLNTTRDDLIKTYPSAAAKLSTEAANDYTLKNIPTIYYKR
jgi:hypothetical protein